MPFEGLPGISTGGGAISGGAAEANGDNEFRTGVNNRSGGIRFGNSGNTNGGGLAMWAVLGIATYFAFKG